MGQVLLAPLQAEFDALRAGHARPADFSRQARAHAALLAALPPRYT